MTCSGYYPCREQGCKSITAHHTGFCKIHRKPVQCARYGCKTMFVPKSMKSRFCDEHKKSKWLPKVDPDWIGV